MKKDIFISYSSNDLGYAEIICNYFENNKLNCWIAPRNIDPGIEWAQSIIQGIDNCQVFLLIYSQSANTSQQVLRELERAVHKNIPILPFITSEFNFNESFLYFISTHQWLKGYPLPLESYLKILLDNVKKLIENEFENQGKLSSSNFHDYNFYFETYRENLISETNNNLVLELYDKSYYEDLCIAPFFILTDPSSLKKKIIDLESILKYPRASIIGEPGSGKTTALRKLCLELLQQNPLKICPVYISLAGISINENSNGFVDFTKYIDEEVSIYGCPDVQTLKKATGAEIILLLDGWDEILDENHKILLKKFIAMSNFRFIISSRPEAQRSLPFTERFEITPLSYERMNEFIRLRLKNDNETNNLLNWLSCNPVMMKLAELPLNLSIITIVFQEKGNIEKINRTQLFERAFEAILNQQHHLNYHMGFSTNHLPIEQVELILQNIAYSLMTSGDRRFFSGKELKIAISKVLGSYSEEISNLLIGKLGILRDRRSGRMEFFHLWYQEFLTAKFIIENGKDIIEELNNKNLASVLPYTVGILNSSNQSFEILNKIQIHDIFNFCRAVSECTFTDVQYSVIIKKVLNYSETKIPKIPVRIELAKAIAQLGAASIHSLYIIASDENNNDYSRRACFEALSILDSNSYNFKRLLIDLLDSKSQGLLWHVIEQVGSLKIPESLQKLELLFTNENAVTAGDSIWAINEITGKEKYSLNESQLSNMLTYLYSFDEHLMGHALRTIGRLKIIKAIKILENYLNIYENPYRWIAVEAATMINCEESNSLLSVALHDKDLRVVAAALRGISERSNINDDEILNNIKNLMQNNTWVPLIEGPLSNLASSVYYKLLNSKRPDKLPVIYLGRHCKTRWNLENKLQGSINLPLCEEGIVQANSYIEYISKLGITKIITSNAVRAKQTSIIYSQKLGIPIVEIPGLRELDHGLWEGKTFNELLNNTEYKYKQWLENPTIIPIKDSSESTTIAQQRIIEAIKQIINTYKNEYLLIITHKHIRAILMCALKNLPLNHFKEFITDDTLPLLIPEDDLINL